MDEVSMAIENIEDYWRGEPNFGLRRKEWVIEIDCRDTDIEDIIPRQSIKLSTAQVQQPSDDRFIRMCAMGLVPFASELLTR
jgi:hypothetical protein